MDPFFYYHFYGSFAVDLKNLPYQQLVGRIPPIYLIYFVIPLTFPFDSVSFSLSYIRLNIFHILFLVASIAGSISLENNIFLRTGYAISLRKPYLFGQCNMDFSLKKSPLPFFFLSRIGSLSTLSFVLPKGMNTFLAKQYRSYAGMLC